MSKIFFLALVVAVPVAGGLASTGCRAQAPHTQQSPSASTSRVANSESRVPILIRVAAPPSPAAASGRFSQADYDRAQRLTENIPGVTRRSEPAIPTLRLRQVTRGGRPAVDGVVTGALIRAEISPAALQTLPPAVRRRTFVDVAIQVSPPTRKSVVTPTLQTLKARLHVADLTQNGMTGDGVFIGVVDEGFNVGALRQSLGCVEPAPSCVKFSTNFSDNVANAWAIPGASEVALGLGHGTMVAFDALIAARKATLFDVVLPPSEGLTRVSSALDGYTKLVTKLLGMQTGDGVVPPMVLVNSWSLRNPAIDDPGNTYFANGQHEMAAAIDNLATLGVDIVFAAGNCGPEATESDCGDNNDRARQGSIYGANSYSSVITVGAVDLNDNLLRYSSQGPGRIDPEKPDVVSYAQFEGANPYMLDSGTSASAPVVAGLIAAFRQRMPFDPARPETTPAMMRDRVIRAVGSCFKPGTRGKHTKDRGFGIVSGSCLVEEATLTSRNFAPLTESRLARR